MSADTTAPVDAPVAAAPTPARRACVVTLGGRPFAIDVIDTREVVVLDATTQVPGAPTTLVGVMNLRGNVLPVIEARPLLGLPVPAAIGRARALVLARAGHRAAVLIERVLGLTVFETVIPPAVDTTPEGLILGDLIDDVGERATVIDAGALLHSVRRAWDSTTHFQTSGA